ncbi:MAG: hypothetical protein ACFCUT_20825 [Kiloniellaceae bacterium]
MNDLEFIGDYRQPQLSARQRAHGHDGSSAGDFTFGDFLDIINPLQHIPVVSHIYRAITGDEISPHARIFGGTLFGGPAGFMSSIANAIYEEIAGEDIGETVIAFFTGEDDGGEPQFAEAEDGAIPAAGAAEALPPLETAAAPGAGAALPEAAPGLLTGQDALNALFMDLRGNPQPAGRSLAAKQAEPIPLPGRGTDAPPVKAYPLPSRHIRVATPPAELPASAQPPAPADTTAAASSENVVHPLLFAQESAGSALADRMMQALDKYQAVARQGTAEQERDKEDKVRWQADPATTSGGS